MKDIRTYFSLLSLFVGLSSFLQVQAQNTKNIQNIFGNLSTYARTNAPEKVYVHTDKDYYTNGENIWLKAYILNGITHLPSDKSLVVYVELVDYQDEIIAQQKLYASSAGASGDIVLPKNIKAGTYVLRAYTKYMLNDKEPVLFQKEIPIWAQRINASTSSEKTARNEKKEESTAEKIIISEIGKPEVQFFPEGGDLITGLESVIGIKITDKNGNGLSLKGKIFDEGGTLVSAFKSYEFGLAKTSFLVETDVDYYLQIQIDGKAFKYPIPKALLKGYTLRVLNMGEYLKIRVVTTIRRGLEGALLLGHLRGALIMEQVFKKNSENVYTVKLLTSKLSDGIAQFTLFTPDGEPVCERLTFVENENNNFKLSVETDKSNYGFRGKVNIDLALADDGGEPLEGDFSMSVVTQKGLQKDPVNIKSWLLLNSDLGGTIANPNFFFQEDLKGRKFQLDLLMLTHGWRRFAWKSFTSQRVSKELTFPPEKGIMINGNTTAFQNRFQPKKTLTTLSVLAEEISQEKKPTNAQGKFSYGPFYFKDSVETIINAERLPETNKKDEFAIYLDPPFPSIKTKSPKKRRIKTTTIANAQPYLEEAQRKRVADFKYDPKVTRLEEVVVKSKKKTRQELIDKELNSRTIYGSANNRLFPDSIPWAQNAFSVLDILRLVPGVQVFGNFPNQTVQIRGAVNFGGPVPPLYVIDGVPVQVSFIQTMQPYDILFVDVLKGPEAAIYGSRGGGGVVAFYTKRGGDLQQVPDRVPGVANFTVPGFYKAREFYAPNYELSIPEHEKPDYRTTLYWDPDVTVKDGTVSDLNFYTGDSAGTYTIRIEGVTLDGRPVNRLYDFQVLEGFP